MQLLSTKWSSGFILIDDVFPMVLLNFGKKDRKPISKLLT